jgi:hypothetical protein
VVLLAEVFAVEQVITDTASYSDIVFGLFAICGYQFSPRIADIGDTRLWRIRATTGPRPSYGKFDEPGQHTIKLEVIRREWEDMLRVAGSLTTGKVRAYDLIRRPRSLAPHRRCPRYGGTSKMNERSLASDVEIATNATKNNDQSRSALGHISC